MTKLLLDESLPVRLTRVFPDQITVRSVQSLGWLGIKNGQLLKLASDEGFAALLTADKNIEHQQNVDQLPIAIIVMRVHPSAFPTLVPFVPDVVALCEAGISESVYHVPPNE